MTEAPVKSQQQQLSSGAINFRKHWQLATADDNITLHGFRRFKTAHLLNLRFLEEEIAELDYTIYQAGLSLGCNVSDRDRLGLKHSKKDSTASAASAFSAATQPQVQDVITRDLVLKLRDLLEKYDQALAAFNNIIKMETFSLLDDAKQSTQRPELTLHEIYKTRLLRVDLDSRSRTDPFQRQVHKWLRSFRYWKLTRSNAEQLPKEELHGRDGTYQNSVWLSAIIARGLVTLLTLLFLISPLAILLGQDRNQQLITISLFILAFLLLMSVTLRISSFELMAGAAAYAAVLSAFIANGDG